jgi:ribose transport system substrate-binding protein
MTRANDLLTAHPDVDCVYATNGDVVSGTMEAMAKHTDVDAKLFGTDLDPDVLEGLQDGRVAAANGAHWINGDFSTALLINYLRGNDIKDADGTAPMLIVPTMTLPSNMVDLYNTFWIEQQPFSDEEMQSFVGADVTAESLQSILDGYSIDSRLQAKVDAGLLTQEELDAAEAAE